MTKFDEERIIDLMMYGCYCTFNGKRVDPVNVFMTATEVHDRNKIYYNKLRRLNEKLTRAQNRIMRRRLLIMLSDMGPITSLIHIRVKHD